MKHYTTPNTQIYNVKTEGLMGAQSIIEEEEYNRSRSRKSSSSSDREEYARGVKQGMADHDAGGYNPGRNTSRAYQEGYRHGHSEW